MHFKEQNVKEKYTMYLQLDCRRGSAKVLHNLYNHK